MATYLALHKCVQQDALRHGPYAETLPLPEQLHTPLYFSDSELDVLRGTNLFAATHDRRSEWQKEWQQVTENLVDPAVHLSLQWYLWACTMISSRAFSSTLLPPSHPDAAEATPILIPGVDVLDHSPTSKVLWQTDVETGTISIHNDVALSSGSEVLNNYGPKPNEELVLGYGFAIENNPADIVALKLVVPPPLDTIAKSLGLTNERFLISRQSGIPEELLAVIRLMVSSEEERETIGRSIAAGPDARWQTLLGFVGFENEFDALDTLTEMLDAKLIAIKETRDNSVFQNVNRADMVKWYIAGQAEVLESAIAKCEELMQAAMQRADAEEET